MLYHHRTFTMHFKRVIKVCSIKTDISSKHVQQKSNSNQKKGLKQKTHLTTYIDYKQLVHHT